MICRVVDWDVEGLRVWCDLPGCARAEPCMACELVHEAELLGNELRFDPYLQKARDVAARRNALAMTVPVAEALELVRQ